MHQLYLALIFAFLTGVAVGFFSLHLIHQLSDRRKRRPARDFAPRQAGNVFFMLFGAIGLVGVLGASSMTIMKGPVKSMAMITKRTIAENNMIAAGKLALIAATNQEDGGNCDADSYIEPVPASESGSGPKPSGGGYLPATIGASLQDPWGNTYGYCAWDHGPEIGTGDCADENRLAGEASGQGIAIAVISSGADRTFQTACADHPDYAFKAPGSDDIVLQYTYQEAQALSSGLWNIKQGEPETAEIAKNIEIEGAVRFGIAGEDPGQVGIAACSGPNHINRMRYNPFGKQIEVCLIDDENYLWRPVSGGSGVPLGTIAPFDSAECPAGWEEVTDLAGRMIMGVGGGYSLGDTGGAATVTLTTAQAPSHTHPVDPPSTGTNTAGAHTHTYTRYLVGGSGGPIQWGGDADRTYQTVSTASSGAHSHSVNIPSFNSGSAGSGGAHENRPPYRVYTFCRHVGDDGEGGSGSDTLAGLECEVGELPKWDGEDWVCALDSDSDTLEALDCEANEFSQWNGSAWECAAISDSDTLAGLNCEVDQLAKWNGSAWACDDGSDLWTLDGGDIYYDGGNVGIGTIEPQARLHIVDTTRITAPNGQFLHLESPNSPAGQRNWGVFDNSQTGTFAIKARNDDWTNAGDNKALFMKHSNGNVGIGINEPNYKLDVNGSLRTAASVNIHAPYNGSARIVFYPTSGSGNQWELYPQNAYFGLYDRTSSAYRIVVENGGYVGIGHNNPSYKLHVNGSIAGSAFVNSSDRRLKDNIEPIDQARIKNIYNLQGVSFNWKDDGQPSIGFIAQDVEKFYPELVHTDEVGMKSVEYGNITSLLIEAVKETKSFLDDIAEKITQLIEITSEHETRLSALEEQNRDLRTMVEEQGREIEALQTNTQ